MKSEKKDDNNKLVVVSNKIVKTISRTGVLVKKGLNNFTKMKIGKVSGKHILVGALALVFLLLCLNLFKSNDVNYPIIYNNSDGDLYLMDVKGKNEEDAIKLANGESVSNVIYANTSDRYVLFQKNDSLYLYDASSKDETTKIMDNVLRYSFTEDDKYVVAIDDKNNLKIYNYKETEKIESDVSNIVRVSSERILYEKENKLYVRSLNPKKEDRQKVTEEYDAYVTFSKDGKQVLYINNDKELYAYNIKKDTNKKIAKDVSSYYCDDKSCNKLFYIENSDKKTIYYYDGKNEEKVAKDINSINAYDVSNKQVVYSTFKDSKYTLYYQSVGHDAVKIEGKLNSIRTVKIFDGKGIYYISGENEVKYAKINGAKLGDVKSIAKDVTGYLYLHKDGYAFVAKVDKSSNGTLFIAKNGKAREIDDNVNSSLITVSKDGKRIYYLKDYKSSGDLYVTNGGKGKKIADDIYTFEYVNNDLLYYIKDYSSSKSRGDLYRYNNKSVKLASNVTRIASVPVYFELNK